jgi:alpha-beta hydrolase superfamily lysophospholipase
VWIHGLNDYGGRASESIHLWLSAGLDPVGATADIGIRVVVLDLPGHGRSDGQYLHFYCGSNIRHVLFRDILCLPRVVRQLVEYITKYDNPAPEGLKEVRKVFIGGGSLGGWTALVYGLNPTPNTAGIIAWVPFHTLQY